MDSIPIRAEQKSICIESNDTCIFYQEKAIDTQEITSRRTTKNRS